MSPQDHAEIPVFPILTFQFGRLADYQNVGSVLDSSNRSNQGQTYLLSYDSTLKNACEVHG
jgi:hypothetical protein